MRVNVFLGLTVNALLAIVGKYIFEMGSLACTCCKRMAWYLKKTVSQIGLLKNLRVQSSTKLVLLYDSDILLYDSDRHS